MSTAPQTSLRLPQRLDILKALETPPPTPDFVLPGLPTGTVGAVVAPGATGKTLFLLQVCAAVATGTSVLGGLFEDNVKAAAPAKVVLVVAEETMDVMHARLHAAVAQLLSQSRDLSNAEKLQLRDSLAEHLHLYPLAGTFRMLLDGRDPSGQDGLAALSRLSEGSRLVVIDPLRQFHTGDENDSWVMTSLLQELQVVASAGPRAVLVAHHTNKAATLSGQGERAGASRGSAAFTDAVRWQLNLSALDNELAAGYGIAASELRHHVRADLSKANYLPPQVPIVLRREAGGAFVKLNSMRPASGPARKNTKRAKP
jgi:regulatory protein RepA